MRMLSASNIKKNTQPARCEPNEGTRIRALWDVLQKHRGIPVHLKGLTHTDGGLMNYLRDYYGLDIRLVRRANAKRGHTSQHMLVGEWIGRVYIDYRIEKSGKENPNGTETSETSTPPQGQRADSQRNAGRDAR